MLAQAPNRFGHVCNRAIIPRKQSKGRDNNNGNPHSSAWCLRIAHDNRRTPHPDFVVMHPQRGLLILETKDWKMETIQRATRQIWEIVPDGQLKVVINPLAQARHCAIQVVNALERDPHAWGDMAVICRHHAVMDECASALARRKLPYQVRKAPGSFKPNADSIKVLTMHASKGLEFAVVALPGVGQMPAPGDDEQEEARLFYVAATRATQRLVITASGDGGFGRRLDNYLPSLGNAAQGIL